MTAPAPPPLRVLDLHAGYGKFEVLHNVSLEVGRGEAVIVLGANGAGKSTLLRAITGMADVSAGVIEFEGADLTGRPSHVTCARGLAHVPEGRQLFGSLTVLENLRLGAFPRRREVRYRAFTAFLEEVYEIFPVLAERSRQAAGSLSGGQQQMLAIGMALAAHPTMLLLDEPSAGLSPIAGSEIFEALEHLNRDLGVALLVVEQKLEIVGNLARRAYLLANGEISGGSSYDEMSHSEGVLKEYFRTAS